MKVFLVFLSNFFLIIVSAQYTTPGTGIVWNMDSLVQNSNAVQFISAKNYRVIEDITISANDSVFILDNNVRFASGVQITVSGGSLYIQGGSNTGSLIADQQGQNYKGFRLEGNSIVSLDNVIVNDCGGIKALTPNFKIINSTLENNPTDLNSSGFIELTSGKPEILNNEFKNNVVSAISSAANATVAPIIKNNIFEGNVTSNTNRPQINLSPSGVNDTTYIESNTITGSSNNEMAGGIAFSALAGGFGNVIIRNNTITNNRYGITVLGNNLFALIENNQIRDNNTQNSPNLGGSGINFNGNATSLSIVSNNDITGNLWGITVLGAFNVNLGDSHIGGSNPGLNTFSENENGGNTYALFNNTPNPINATNNCWEINTESTLQNAESVISHEIDDNTLGEVTFDPIKLCNVVGVEFLKNESILVYPNPTNDFVTITTANNSKILSMSLQNIKGQLIISPFIVNKNKVKVNLKELNKGIYFAKVLTSNSELTHKVIVQ